MRFDSYVRLPQWRHLATTADDRLIATIARADEHGRKYVSTLWQLDPAGERPARPLTPGQAAFAGSTARGDLLYTAGGALWLLGADDTARMVARPPGGVFGVTVSASGTLVFGTAALPASTGLADDSSRRARRDESGITAILHEEFPIRYWDHDLGPDSVRLVTGELTEDVLAGRAELELRDLTGHVGRALGDECTWDVSPDGRTVVSAWLVAEPRGSQRHTLVAIDIATGARRTIADSPEHEYHLPRWAPDGHTAVVRVSHRLTTTEPGTYWLGLVSADGEVRDLTADWDRWPLEAVWTPDSRALIVNADDDGRRPLWRVDVETGALTRLTHDDATYQNLSLSKDGKHIHARRAAVDSPPVPVRIAVDGELTWLADRVPVPGRLAEIRTEAADGTPIRAWLALPEHTDEPVPLVVWLHGGPTQSANGWGWAWNPWPIIAEGHAVLLPDFAMSTGYGLDFVRRGWGRYGDLPYTDVLTLTDAACARPDIDAHRLAVVGTSFGGYLANWIAGHTGRFRAIVTQASTWQLDLIGESDLPHFFAREMTAATADANSPHHFADHVTTPMLIVHGGRDQRVPVAEAHRLWWDLMSRQDNETGPHKFLYFPAEGHFISKPSALRIWYETVLAFLATHLHDAPWQRPDSLS